MSTTGKQKMSPTMMWTMIGGGVALVAAFATNGPPPVATTKKPPVKSVANKATSDFTKEDELAKFDQLSSGKDAFRPVVAKRASGKDGSSLQPNEIPSSFAGGTQGWFYTGTAVFDGRPGALFENRTKGEALYVHTGEKWQTSTILTIHETTVTIQGPTGSTKLLDLLADPPQPKNGGPSPLAGNFPGSTSVVPLAVDPTMMGQIAGDPNAAPADATAQPAQGGNQRRRGRRNGGGGGGGNQGQMGFVPSDDTRAVNPSQNPDEPTANLPETPSGQ